jgi:excisionase family DNA binding protein
MSSCPQWTFMEDTNMTQKLLLTIPEAADRLGVGRSFLHAAIQRRELSTVKLGRARRVPVGALEHYVARLLSAQETIDEAQPQDPAAWPVVDD